MTEGQVSAKGYFDADEWMLISSAPAVAGIYTALASERKITDKEWKALGSALDPANASKDDELLAASLADTYDTVSQALAMEKLPVLGLGDVNMEDVDAVRQATTRFFSRVNTALSDAPTQVAVRFKDSILLVAQKVAEAQAEGGFLGIGARDISAGEVQALKDIAGNLGYDTSADSEWSRHVIMPVNTYRAQ
jgi:hypothetical protein